MDDFEDFIGGALTSGGPKNDLQSEMQGFGRFAALCGARIRKPWTTCRSPSMTIGTTDPWRPT